MKYTTKTKQKSKKSLANSLPINPSTAGTCATAGIEVELRGFCRPVI
jgi:hypothetical protein